MKVEEMIRISQPALHSLVWPLFLSIDGAFKLLHRDSDPITRMFYHFLKVGLRILCIICVWPDPALPQMSLILLDGTK